jgi:cytochrome b561
MALNFMVPRFTLNTTGYSHLSIITHWLGAILVIALFATYEGKPGDAVYVFHVSFGPIAGLFLLWRVWHRIRCGFTDKPDQANIYNLASRIVIWGFLVSIVLVIISGYFLP